MICCAQDTNAPFGAWCGFLLKTKTSDDWAISTIVQYRDWNVGENIQTFLVGVEINHALTKNVILGSSFGYLSSGELSDLFIERKAEYRWSQSGIYRYEYGGILFSNRFRVEERLFEDSNIHFRYRWKSSVSFEFAENVMMDISNEYFVAGGLEFDQNRAMIGMNFYTAPDEILQVGTMFQHHRNYDKNLAIITYVKIF